MTKVILLTGASRGIGASIATYLLGQGHKAILVSRSTSAMQSVTAPFPAENYLLVTADLGKDTTSSNISGSSSSSGGGGDGGSEELEKPVLAAIERFGRLDGLVLNHGTLEAGRVAEMDVACWKRQFDVNFFSCVGLVCIHTSPHAHTYSTHIFTYSLTPSFTPSYEHVHVYICKKDLLI